MQTDLTRSQVEIEIAKNHGEADLAQGRLRAEQTVVNAEAESRRQVLVAESEGKAKALIGEGESQRLTFEGEARAKVLRQQIDSYGDPRLYALAVVAEQLAHSDQPLVPQQLFVSASAAGEAGECWEQNPLGTLIQMLLAEKAGFHLPLDQPLAACVASDNGQ